VTTLLKAGDLTVICTAEVATQTDREGEQFYEVGLEAWKLILQVTVMLSDKCSESKILDNRIAAMK